MRTIGLVGGMSWQSTQDYYRGVNEGVARALGGLSSARCVTYSVDFGPVAAYQANGQWAHAAAVMAHGARAVERAGADFVVLCTNTMHRLAPAIEAATRIPLLHIADATAREAVARGFGRVGLLGTRFTMEQDFYRGRLEQRGLEVVVPNEADRFEVNRVIYDELCVGLERPASRAAYVRIAQALAAAGCDAVILGCTEIAHLLRPEDVRLPLLDTTTLHVDAAVAYALG